MVEQTMAVEAELTAVIEALKDVSAEEREAAYLTLEKHHGVAAVARARALLAIEDRGAEITAGLDAANPESIPEPAEGVTEDEREEDEVAVEFHESDFAPQITHPPTVKQQQEMLESLTDLWDSDPIEYAKKKREAAGRLDVSEAIVEEAVKRIRAERTGCPGFC